MYSLILFANGNSDMETGHWIGILGTLLGILTAASLLIVAWINNGTRLMKRIDDLTSRMFQMQDDQRACKAENADLKSEVHALSVRLREMEAKTGTLTLSPIPGVVVADLRGTVRIFSPSLTPMLGYLPDEVQGRKIDMLVPPELLEQHKAGFGHAVSAGLPARDRPLITYALAKSGARVPVSIFLKSLQPEGLISAEIRQRASGEPEK